MLLPQLLWLGALAGAPPGDTTDLAWTRPDASDLTPIYGVAWKADLGTFELLATNHEEWTRPVISPDGARVYIGSREGRLEARDIANGELLWFREGLGAIGADMLEYRDVVVVGSDSDLVALDRSTGEERWRVEIGGRIGGGLARAGKLVVVPVRPNGFVAVDADAGQRQWQVKRPTPDGLTVRGQARPTIDDERSVAYLGFSDGALLAVSLADGATRWVAALGSSADFFADVDAAPILLDGGKGLLVAAYNTSLFRLETERGSIEWSKPMSRITGLSAAGGGLVVATHGAGEVMGLRPADGAVAWRYRSDAGALSAATILPQGRLAVSSSRGPVAILAVADGRPLQLISPGTGCSVPPAGNGPYLVVFSNGGLVLGLRAGKGGGVILR